MDSDDLYNSIKITRKRMDKHIMRKKLLGINVIFVLFVMFWLLVVGYATLYYLGRVN